MGKIIKEYNRLPKNKQGNIKLLNNINGSEWASLSKSIVTYGGAIAEKRKLHGAAYPIELVEHFIKIFTQQGDNVLDPFMGVGTTADACRFLNRNCFGFELNPKFYELAVAGPEPLDVKNKDVHPIEVNIYNESCQHIKEHIPENTIDLTVTSPPYSNHLHKIANGFATYTYEKNIYKGQGRVLANPYSQLDVDFGNQTWEGYSSLVLNIMKDLYDVGREGSFNVWVVRDYRDVEEHIPYVNLHGKIMELGIKAGWVVTDVIIWDQTAQRKLVKLGGIKARRFYFNIGHSYIIIFRKNIEGEKFKSLL
jgi:DNA modification methylase